MTDVAVWPWRLLVWIVVLQLALRQPWLVSADNPSDAVSAGAPPPSDTGPSPSITTPPASADHGGPSGAGGTGGSGDAGTGVRSGSVPPPSPASTGTQPKLSSSKNEPYPTQTYPVTDPAGALNLVTPAITAQPYFPIGQPMTFAWNYSSLQATPKLNVEAYNSVNSFYYMITANLSGQTTKITWDTEKYQSANPQMPLLTGNYQLVIYDARNGRDIPAKPGYLNTYRNFIFGLYAPKKAVPLDKFNCPGCTSGSGSLNIRKNINYFWVFYMGTASIALVASYMIAAGIYNHG